MGYNGAPNHQNYPEFLWLLKNKLELHSQYKGEFSLFLEKLIKEGYEVEEYAKLLFTNGLDTWGRMVTDSNFNEGIKQTRKNLLTYCKLDTLAMV